MNRKHHKTLTTHGEAYIVIDNIERWWLERYVEAVRPKSYRNHLFLNSNGKQCIKISRDLTNHFQMVTGVMKPITATFNTRHSIVTTVSERL